MRFRYLKGPWPINEVKSLLAAESLAPTEMVFRAFGLLTSHIHLDFPDDLRVVSLAIQELQFTFQVLTASRLILGRATGVNVLLLARQRQLCLRMCPSNFTSVY
jgi:hypothetical protein